MLARLDPRRLDRLWFPLGEWTKEETRAARASRRSRGRRRAPRARRPASSPAATTGDFLARHGVAAGGGPDRGRGGPRAGPPRRVLALHARPAARPRRLRRRPLYALETRRRDEHGRRRSARGARPHVGRRSRPGACSSRSSASQAKLRYRSPAAPGARRGVARGASGSRSTSPRTASLPARPPCSTRTTRRRRGPDRSAAV